MGKKKHAYKPKPEGFVCKRAKPITDEQRKNIREMKRLAARYDKVADIIFVCALIVLIIVFYIMYKLSI